ncbi:MAG: hypothetical protein KTR21_08800 [Rhodobacteraceae bacterium]|nr:hypothetical protein [Paracoccaceae bacterium]
MAWDWADVFGEIWFWALAGILWARAAFSAYGAPRQVIAAAMVEPGAADFARDLVRYRLGPGSSTPRGLTALRLPALGALIGYGVLASVQGDALCLALLASLTPIAIVTLSFEGRVAAAAQAAVDEAGRAAFADVLEQIWRVRLAAVVGSILLTLIAAAVTRPT